MTTDTFFVLHEVVDTEAWDQRFGEVMDNFKEGSPSECYARPIFAGNKPTMTFGSDDGSAMFCVWSVPQGMSESDFQTFIDGFVGPSAKNTPRKVEQSFGMANVNESTYIEDIQKFQQTGSVYPYAGQGDVYFVYHKVGDKVAFDGWFGEKMGAATDATSTQELIDAWKMRAGYSGLVTLGFANGDYMCLWEAPAGTTKEEFKEMIDGFTEGNCKNEHVFKVNSSMACNSRVLHKDFYTVDALVAAKAGK